VLAVAMTSSGCGSSDNTSDVAPKTPDDLLVTKSDIEAAKPDSPARTLLSWWQAIQFNDARKAVSFYAKGISESHLESQLRSASPQSQQKLEVEETSYSGHRATVYVVIITGTTTPGGELNTISRQTTSFYLVRRSGRWLLNNNHYLSSRAAAAAALQKAARNSSNG
jgi:hypothetical protein